MSTSADSPTPYRDAPSTADEVRDLRESTKEMGVEDADDRSAEELVEEVRHTQADDEISPSEWEAKEE